MFVSKFQAAVLVMMIVAWIACATGARAGISDEEEVCDTTADFFLATEDYPRAIESHLRVIAAHPKDALAHYHLGFAYGMVGRHHDELREYLEAVGLDLKKWDLFLNLGRLYLENNEINAAQAALTTAATLGPGHAEAHFNLALAHERQGLLGKARDEILTSLRLDANQPDARNMLGLIYAEQGNFAEAQRIWSELDAAEPNFAPARVNLELLRRVSEAPHAQCLTLNEDREKH